MKKCDTFHLITAKALKRYSGTRMAVCELHQWTRGIGPTARDQAANAALIVKAVNSHQQLVDALRAALPVVSMRRGDRALALAKQMRAALTATEA